MDRKTFYITTPIYYVNDKPHIGHAYTTVAADVLARHHRSLGHDVFFLTGTDEHGQKVQQTAAKFNRSPQEHADLLVVNFQNTWKKLDIRYNDFIRTTEPRHKQVVQAILQRLYDAGEIYPEKYAGWYSTAAERFWTEKDLVDGKCPETGLPVEYIEETNYFFRMGKRQEWLIRYIEEHPRFILPESRRNEVLGFLKNNTLEDLCISRPRSRLAWGIPLPFDENYVTYVWFDALINYISGIGYGAGDGRFERFWPANHHLVGKDILTTHAVYWSTMLHALGVEPCENLFAHGWWTVEGRKMSKSLGNFVDPNELVDLYGSDGFRYFLLREMPFGADGDFSAAGIVSRINSDLGNDLGNLANRSLPFVERQFDGLIPPLGPETPEDCALKQLHQETLAAVLAAYHDVSFTRVLDAIWTFIRAANKYMDSEAPWTLAKKGDRERLGTVLYNIAEACRIAAVLTAPFLTTKSPGLLRKLGMAGGEDDLRWKTIETWGGLPSGIRCDRGDPLFPRLEALPAAAPVSGPAMAPPGPAVAAPGSAEGKKGKSIPGPAAEITYDEFARIDLRAALVEHAERVPKSDKLLKLSVRVGEETRQIVAGIGQAYAPEQLIGRKVIIVANLKPAKLMGLESCGMVLAAGPGGADLAIAGFDREVAPGTRVK